MALHNRYFSIQELRADMEWLKAQTRRKIGMKANRSSVEELEAEVDHLTLCVATLFRILVVQGVVAVDDLKQLFIAVDAEDGQIDGAYRGRDLVTGEQLPEQINPFANLDQG